MYRHCPFANRIVFEATELPLRVRILGNAGMENRPLLTSI